MQNTITYRWKKNQLFRQFIQLMSLYPLLHYKLVLDTEIADLLTLKVVLKM